jgi:hypothetical protein
MHTFWYRAYLSVYLNKTRYLALSFFVREQGNGQYCIGMKPIKRSESEKELATLTDKDLQNGWSYQFGKGLLRIQRESQDQRITLMYNNRILPQIPTPLSELVDKRTLERAHSAWMSVSVVGFFSLLGIPLIALLPGAHISTPLQAAIAGIVSSGIPLITLLPGTDAALHSLQPAIAAIWGIVFLILTYFVNRYSVAAYIAAIILYSVNIAAFLIGLGIELSTVPGNSSGTFTETFIPVIVLLMMITNREAFTNVCKAVKKENAQSGLPAPQFWLLS